MPSKPDYGPRKITAELIRQADRWTPPAKPREIRDKAAGLILRHQPSGYLGLYAELGRGKRERVCNAREIIDPQADMTMAKARADAKRVRGEDAGGRSFKAEREAARAVPTLADWLDPKREGSYGWWVVENRKTGDRTLATLNRVFADHFGRHKLDAITPALIEAWRTRRQRQVRRETVNREMVALKACLAKAAEWRVIDQHPLASVKPLQVDRHRRVIRALSDAEVGALKDALAAREERIRGERASANEWRHDRGYDLLPALDGQYVDALRPAVLVSLGTGLRRGECFGLRWEWIDLKAATIHLPGEATKAYTGREAPLNQETAAVLRAWNLQQGRPTKGYVFGHPDGAAIGDLKKSFQAVLEHAGIERENAEGRVTWHSLRHTFGTRLGAAGVDADTLRRLMGHASLMTTQRYLHSTQDRMRAAIERIGADA